MMSEAGVQPFRIEASDAELEDLRERLRRTRFPDAVANSGWRYGTDLNYLRELVTYWSEQYDWRAAEQALNSLPQFTAQVDGRRLHFVHQRGVGPKPLPLLISHGWPGSFVEMTDIIGPLSDPAAHGGDPADAFDVVVPSLPGYGFSQGAAEGGMTARKIGEVFAELMTRTLGYRRYGMQGGDWGAVIAASMAFHHRSDVIGLHMNMLGVRPWLGEGAPELTEEEQVFAARVAKWQQDEAAYMQIQGTRPQTLGYGLMDSPAGLAGWIIEKFRAWSDCGGDIELRFSKDRLLTNIMIYWLSGCITSSMRLYYEQRRNPWRLGKGERIEVPTGFAVFPREPVSPHPPRSWLERAANVQHWSVMPAGGHFAAMEEPQRLVEDIRAFFRPLRGS